MPPWADVLEVETFLSLSLLLMLNSKQHFRVSLLKRPQSRLLHVEEIPLPNTSDICQKNVAPTQTSSKRSIPRITLLADIERRSDFWPPPHLLTKSIVLKYKLYGYLLFLVSEEQKFPVPTALRGFPCSTYPPSFRKMLSRTRPLWKGSFKSTIIPFRSWMLQSINHSFLSNIVSFLFLLYCRILILIP